MAGVGVREKLLKQIASVEEEYPLRQHTEFAIAGVADYYTVATSTVEIAAAVKAAIDADIPYQVIGSGSRSIFSDGGFPGLIIKNISDRYGIAMDKSQVVVDSGMLLTRFITVTAGLGLGGLTQFYGEQGTIGGALYDGLYRGNYSLLSNLRYITAVVPPARLDREATIIRYKREWLDKEPGLSRLRFLKESRPEDPQPVILTAMFQLTSVRPDELRTRLQERVKESFIQKPSGQVLGPLFKEDPSLPLLEMLREIKAAQIRIGNLFVDSKNPLYVRAKGPVRSSEVRELIEVIQAKIESKYAVVPRSRFEYLGVW